MGELHGSLTRLMLLGSCAYKVLCGALALPPAATTTSSTACHAQGCACNLPRAGMRTPILLSLHSPQESISSPNSCPHLTVYTPSSSRSICSSLSLPSAMALYSDRSWASRCASCRCCHCHHGAKHGLQQAGHGGRRAGALGGLGSSKGGAREEDSGARGANRGGA